MAALYSSMVRTRLACTPGQKKYSRLVGDGGEVLRGIGPGNRGRELSTIHCFGEHGRGYYHHPQVHGQLLLGGIDC